MKEVNISRKHLFAPSTRENMRQYWYKFSRNKLSLVGLAIVLISIFLALFGELIMPYPQHVEAFVDYANRTLEPSGNYLFGTDLYGRDLFSRCIYAFKGALTMSAIVLIIAVPVGTFLGLLAGYHRGTILEIIIMRITDIFLALPPVILALSISAMLEPNMFNSMLAVTVMWWPWYTRLVYGSAVAISQEYFVKNAELIGASKTHILFREILPNCLSPILTKVALDVGWVILIGATLSFVGLGEQPPTPSFGSMISEGYTYMPNYWWMTIFPSVCIIFIILGFNLLGDGIRDMFDRGRQG